MKTYKPIIHAFGGIEEELIVIEELTTKQIIKAIEHLIADVPNCTCLEIDNDIDENSEDENIYITVGSERYMTLELQK